MTFSVQCRVEFRDTDAAGIVHFSAFFPMMEAAEHEMLRSLGISVLPQPTADADPVTWPRVAASCDYLAVARFEDLLQIDVSVLELGASSVRYGFSFRIDQTRIANGSITTVCCRLIRGDHAGQASRLEKTPIPDSIRKLLEQEL